MSLEPVSASLADWLHEFGFTNGNPFATSEADRESQVLPEFFVDTGQFNLLLGDPQQPQSCLIFAPQGSGKTAYRVMLQSQCAPNNIDGSILAVPYVSHESTLCKLREAPSLTTRDHIMQILHSGLDALLSTVCGSPERAEMFPMPLVGRLAWLFGETAPDLLTPSRLWERISTLKPDFTPPWLFFQQSIRTKQLVQGLDGQNVLSHPAVRLLASIVDANPEPVRLNASAQELVVEFVRLVQSTGIQAVFVLVDRLDELSDTADDPAMVVALLEPLLTSLPIMEAKGLAFKVFLPTRIRPYLGRKIAAHSDRLRILEIEWSDSAIAQMLSRRLLYFSRDRIHALGQVSAGDFSEKIDLEVIRWANGSPRRLIRLGELLLESHARSAGAAQALLSVQDWEDSRRRFFAEYAPPELGIDPKVPQVFVGTRKVELTTLEHRFLLELKRSGGWCEKETLIQQVWDTSEGVTDMAVSRLVRRIREKLELYPSDPVYLLTEHGAGFRLEHIAHDQSVPS